MTPLVPQPGSLRAETKCRLLGQCCTQKTRKREKKQGRRESWRKGGRKDKCKQFCGSFTLLMPLCPQAYLLQQLFVLFSTNTALFSGDWQPQRAKARLQELPRTANSWPPVRPRGSRHPGGGSHLPHHPGYQPGSEKAPLLHSQLQTIPNLLPSLPLQPWPASNQPWPVDTSQPGIQYFRPRISNSSVRHPLLSCPCSSLKPREKKRERRIKRRCQNKRCSDHLWLGLILPVGFKGIFSMFVNSSHLMMSSTPNALC